MTKEEAQAVSIGDTLDFVDSKNTPGRNYGPSIPIAPLKILNIKTEETGHVHFDVGMTLPAGEAALLSMDTGEEIDGSNTYWLHPSRFEFTKD